MTVNEHIQAIREKLAESKDIDKGDVSIDISVFADDIDLTEANRIRTDLLKEQGIDKPQGEIRKSINRGKYLVKFSRIDRPFPNYNLTLFGIKKKDVDVKDKDQQEETVVEFREAV